MKNKQKGFTLIELLVIISIIALLSSSLMMALTSSRQKGRDAKRKQEIAQIQKALELYLNENGQYPTTTGWVGSLDDTWKDFRSQMSNVMPTLPQDPLAVEGYSPNYIISGTAYGYAYYSADFDGCRAGQWYILVHKLEKVDVTSPNGFGCGTPPVPLDYSYGGVIPNNITYVGRASK